MANSTSMINLIEVEAKIQRSRSIPRKRRNLFGKGCKVYDRRITAKKLITIRLQSSWYATECRPVSLSLRRDGSLVLEPVDVNNHPRRWPKDHRRDLQSRHRQLEATRSLSRPIITGTYSRLSVLPSCSGIPFSSFFTCSPISLSLSFSISIPSPALSLRYYLAGRSKKRIIKGKPEMDGIANSPSSPINRRERLKRFNCRRDPCSDCPRGGERV